MLELTATAKGRMDSFIAKMGDMSRMRVGQMIREGCVTVNGRVVFKPAHIVEPDDVVAISAGDAVSETHLKAADLKLEVMYEDDACMVVNKPADVVVHPAVGIKKDEATMLHAAAFLFQERKIPFVASHILVHRLDRETTGCLLLAKTPDAHRALQKQFADRTIKKAYLALVSGTPINPEAVIDAPIGRSTVNRTKMAVHQSSATRDAKTSYRTLGSAKGVSLLVCDLHTGRTHQIRVHLSTIGHPIVGDETYFTKESQKAAELLHVKNLCLHAWKLSFESPVGKHVELTCPLTGPFAKTLKEAGLSLSMK